MLNMHLKTYSLIVCTSDWSMLQVSNQPHMNFYILTLFCCSTVTTNSITFHCNSQSISVICFQQTKKCMQSYSWSQHLRYTYLNHGISLNMSHYWFSIASNTFIMATTASSRNVTAINTLVNYLVNVQVVYRSYAILY